MPSLRTWLNHTDSMSQDQSYHHNLFTEHFEQRSLALNELKPLIELAHNDARHKLRSALQYDSLHPLEEEKEDIRDPASDYPQIFDMNTLKGYFGEFFSGLIAENFPIHGESNWKVPIFSFRWHHTALDQLDMYHQTGQIGTAIVGRTGDDCLAFVIQNGIITKTLFLEAKCTKSHKAQTIKDAHQKVSSLNLIPVEVSRLKDILNDYLDVSGVEDWIYALTGLLRKVNVAERYDCVSYVCGAQPIRANSWISDQTPHTSYTGKRKLAAIEVQLNNVDDLIYEVYGKDIS